MASRWARLSGGRFGGAGSLDSAGDGSGGLVGAILISGDAEGPEDVGGGGGALGGGGGGAITA
jgi:hypothetical protein